MGHTCIKKWSIVYLNSNITGWTCTLSDNPIPGPNGYYSCGAGKQGLVFADSGR